MLYNDFSKALLLHPGIVRIELLTDELVSEVKDIEYSSKNVGFTPIDPIGLHDILGKDLRLILFCSNEFQMFTECFMDIVDSRGTLVGHDIQPEEKDQIVGEGIIWLTDNLYFDLALVNEHHLKTVIRSLALHIEDADEVEPRVFYPCVETADHLNDRFGVSGKIVATVLLGVDGVEFRSFDLRDVHERVFQPLIVSHLGSDLGRSEADDDYRIDHIAC